MGGWTGWWQWLIVLAIVLLLFGGRGKISQLMGDFGKGLRSFKKGVKEDEESEDEEKEEASAVEDKSKKSKKASSSGTKKKSSSAKS